MYCQRPKSGNRDLHFFCTWNYRRTHSGVCMAASEMAHSPKATFHMSKKSHAPSGQIFFLGGLSFTEFNWIITPKQIKSAQISALPRGDPLLKLKCSLCIDKARQQEACEVNLINAARRRRASQAHVCFGRGSSGTGFVKVSSCMSVDVAAREGMEGWRWSRWMRGDQWKRITGTSNHHCTHKISPPTLIQRFQSQSSAGII